MDAAKPTPVLTVGHARRFVTSSAKDSCANAGQVTRGPSAVQVRAKNKMVERKLPISRLCTW